MNDIKQLLPIGSVVLLMEASKPLVIFGIKQSDMETGEEYDYIGVPYPEGNMGTEAQFLFQHEDIQEVLFRGYENEERSAFIEKLEQYYNS